MMAQPPPYHPSMRSNNSETLESFHPNSKRYRACTCHARACSMTWTSCQVLLFLVCLLICLIFAVQLTVYESQLKASVTIMEGVMSEKWKDGSEFQYLKHTKWSGLNKTELIREKGNLSLNISLVETAKVTYFVIAAVLIVPLLISSVALFGLLNGKWQLLLPHMCLMITIFAIAVPGHIAYMAVFLPDSMVYRISGLLLNIGFLLLGIVLHLFVLFWLKKAYVYLRDRREAIEDGQLPEICPVNPNLLQRAIAAQATERHREYIELTPLMASEGPPPYSLVDDK